MKLPDLGHLHTPSKEKVRLEIWWDFMLHSDQLYDKKTGIATCTTCNSKIKLPVDYGKRLPLVAYKNSIGVTIVFRALLNILNDYTPLSPILVVITAFLASALLLVALLKMGVSWTLARYGWSCFDDTDRYALSSVIQETSEDNRRIRDSIVLGIGTTYTIVLLTQLFG